MQTLLNYTDAIQQANIKQQGLEVNAENIEQYGLIDDCIELIAETDNTYIVKYSEDGRYTTINIVSKDGNELLGMEA